MIERIKKGARDSERALDYLWTLATAKPKRAASFTASSRLPIGENLFEKDWDLLIILDSCRYDALMQIASGGAYSFLVPDEIRRMTSVGGSTTEWTTATFDKKYEPVINDTAFISGNVRPYRVLDQRLDMDELNGVAWAPTSWNPVTSEELAEHILAWQRVPRSGTNKPQTDAATVRDLAIRTGREKDYDRAIAHFVEPHYPYVAAARSQGMGDGLSEALERPGKYLQKGGDKEIVWEAYLEELRYGLDNVSALLNNFDAENVVITADHGDAFGEWRWTGLRAYTHTEGMFHPKTRCVPFTKVSATDEGAHEPEETVHDPSATVEDTLNHLGYLA